MTIRTLRDVLAKVSAFDGFFCAADLDPAGLVAIDTRGYAEDRPLHVLAWDDDLEGVGILLAAGADPNGTGDLGETPLHVAVRKGNVALVQLLLSHGADPTSRSDYGDTPFDLAQDSQSEIALALAPRGP
jgi:uncharacterized protein